MFNEISISASFSKKSGNRKPSSSSKGSFNLIKHNYPFIPFKITSLKNSAHLIHHNTVGLNEGIICCFEELLKNIKKVMNEKNSDLQELNPLLKKLNKELQHFSTIPCTSNINTSIFELLNYTLRLLFKRQRLAGILKIAEESPDKFLQKMAAQLMVDTEVIKSKIQNLNFYHAELSNEIFKEMSIVQEKLQQEHKKFR